MNSKMRKLGDRNVMLADALPDRGNGKVWDDEDLKDAVYVGATGKRFKKVVVINRVAMTVSVDGGPFSVTVEEMDNFLNGRGKLSYCGGYLRLV